MACAVCPGNTMAAMAVANPKGCAPSGITTVARVFAYSKELATPGIELGIAKGGALAQVAKGTTPGGTTLLPMPLIAIHLLVGGRIGIHGLS